MGKDMESKMVEDDRENMKRVWEEACCQNSMEGLPDFVLFEVLQRLPQKSIFRFKCVSKRWNSILSDTFFVKSYTDRRSHCSQPWALLYCLTYGVPPEMMGLHAVHRRGEFNSPGFSLQFPNSAIGDKDNGVGQIVVVAVSNGLLLCARRVPEFVRHSHYYVCNPFTMQWLTLPPPPRILPSACIGFMVDPSSGHFLVMRFKTPWYKSERDVDMFCSQTGTWIEKKLVFPSVVSMDIEDEIAVPYKGTFYWTTGHEKIIAYDPKSDSIGFHSIDRPKHLNTDTCMVSIQDKILFGRTLDHACYFEAAPPYFSVWILEDYEKGKWSLESRVDIAEISSSQCDLVKKISSPEEYSMRALAFHPSSSKIIYGCIGSRTLVRLDLSSKTLEIEATFEHADRLGIWSVFPFVLPPWPVPVILPSWKSD